MIDDKPARPVVYEIVVQTVSYLKGNKIKINYNHTLRKPGWADFFDIDEEEENQRIEKENSKKKKIKETYSYID